MRALGEDVSEVLDYVAGYFKVLRQVRPQLSCPRCAAVVQEPVPSRPIARSMAGAGLLAQVVVAKYADHMPLYRQAGIYRRGGIELNRATLASWVREAAALLRPLSGALGRYMRDAEKIHTGDTPAPVLAPGRGKTHTARLWTYVRDDRRQEAAPPAIWYRYSPDRKGERPREHLAGYTGILQADVRRRNIQFGNLTIQFKQAAPSRLYWLVVRQCGSCQRFAGSVILSRTNPWESTAGFTRF